MRAALVPLNSVFLQILIFDGTATTATQHAPPCNKMNWKQSGLPLLCYALLERLFNKLPT